jgi:hypothetical protein
MVLPLQPGVEGEQQQVEVYVISDVLRSFGQVSHITVGHDPFSSDGVLSPHTLQSILASPAAAAGTLTSLELKNLVLPPGDEAAAALVASGVQRVGAVIMKANAAAPAALEKLALAGKQVPSAQTSGA